jgi:dihydrofolate synthase/folylpolyglutamate synthase
MNYTESIDYLYGLQAHGIKLGLDNTRELTLRAGMPQDSFKCVHIAGTNGKGSTAATLQSMLIASGYKTGLFVSPHLLSFTERISTSGITITEAEVARYAIDIRDLSQGLSPTFFEVVTLMGLLYFKHKGVDWAVMETGLGGRLDSTNVIEPACTIITPVAMDHSDYLGDTIQEIAAEKAGIIKQDVPLILAPQVAEARDTITARAAELNAQVLLCGKDFSYQLSEKSAEFSYSSRTLSIKNITHPLKGEYQYMNAALAIAALEQILPGADHPTIVRDGLASLKWPGRLQEIEPGIHIDGAHNPAAAEALGRELLASGMTDICLLIGVMQDKNIREILSPLLPLAKQIIFTSPDYGRSANAEDLKALALEMGFESVALEDTASAIKAARLTELPILITGSFYLLGEALEALGHKGVLSTLRETASNTHQGEK